MKMIYNSQIVNIASSNFVNGIEVLGTAATSGSYDAYSSGTVNNRIYQQLDLSGGNLFQYAYLKISTQRSVFGGSNLGFGL